MIHTFTSKKDRACKRAVCVVRAPKSASLVIAQDCLIIQLDSRNQVHVKLPYVAFVPVECSPPASEEHSSFRRTVTVLAIGDVCDLSASDVGH